MRGPLRGACSEGERCEDYGTGTTFWDIVSASCNQFSCRPAAFCRRLLRVNRTPRACCHRQTRPFPEDRARCREPAPSVNERSLPARPATGGTESTQAMGKVVAEMCTVAKTSISAELLRTITVIHHFATHAARTQRIWPCTSVERSEERLNIRYRSGTGPCM